MAEKGNTRTCIVAVDGSSHSDFALKWYKDNVHMPGDRVILVHTVDHRKHLQYGSVAMAPGNPDSITHAFAAEDKKASQLIEKLKAKTTEYNMDAEFVTMAGEPGECIIHKANSSNADFIVAGCRGLGTIRRTFVGSVSDYILHHADVPVFVCRHT